MEKLIEQIEIDIVRIKKRLTYLLEIERELALLSGGRPSTLKNDIIYQMVWDSYDMVVIDLASLCRWMKGKGGFFNQLNGHLKKFKRPNVKKIKVDEPYIIEDPNGPAMSTKEYKALAESMQEEVRNQIAKNINAAYDRLFPPLPLQKRKFPFCFLKQIPSTSSTNQVTQEHIKALKDKFDKLTEEVIHDRDSRRAHRYEKRKADSSIKMLSLKRINEQFKTLESIIGDIRIITIGGEFSYKSPFFASPSIVAKDIADMIFHGSIPMITNRFGLSMELRKCGASKMHYTQFREDFYLKYWRNILINMLKKLI